jgi:hypothetical protein
MAVEGLLGTVINSVILDESQGDQVATIHHQVQILWPCWLGLFV